MLFVDESSMNFLYFFLKAFKGATYPMGWLRYPRWFRHAVPAQSPNSGPVGILLGSDEAAGLIPDSEKAVQVGISI